MITPHSYRSYRGESNNSYYSINHPHPTDHLHNDPFYLRSTTTTDEIDIDTEDYDQTMDDNPSVVDVSSDTNPVSRKSSDGSLFSSLSVYLLYNKIPLRKRL